MEISLDLGEGWEVFPAGGATGEAYIAQYEGQNKLFLKRNSSPFLAVLSAEGIVPKLIWTKRMENGDVITAQHWLKGRELKPIDMTDKAVAILLSKIHNSKELLNMLQRIGKKQLQPLQLLEDLKQILEKSLSTEKEICNSIQFLEQNLPYINHEYLGVCHCDVNHNNWLMSDEQELYLIDWDGAMIADPALDLGPLLYWYIPKNSWSDWLHNYGLELTANLERRMKWYVVYQTISAIVWYKNRNENHEYEQWIDQLGNMFSAFSIS
ncbi:putative choline kinase involved in LPS biosynthesis [Schinkia azotoformans MEV2011]|uniref:Putative choline kinase involved in LPS biosynthesis n=1 Tax=Schinkia azotoformans MEV2011 TaxID=1348973 RepID=A0A072NIW9_SCHAZ|nr:phosphotransferase family protein [Schinkia azotoformans]KEF37609.1 putative choline kinase involved in LPS biosynthesis [Schinkia azotoformans MEV2011]MEC1695334.1 phosphotransferase family protein [Schinkia azotoformans]MEC1724642.1 phosphotransferase family protein [Schinkia azotoformans]MEC1741099.1 phosphotransferase family protein [Schinkia azotoformans]MEC1747255.1 phosphotransferase family protein [Schinkia azotoformans]